MADEEKNEQTEQEKQAEEKAPEAEAEEKGPEAEAPAEEEAPSEDTPDEGEEAPEEEPPVEEEAPAEEAPDEAEEAAAEGEEAPSAEAPAEEEGDWKARRRLERSRRSGAAGPQRSPEDRAAERTQRRSLAARRRSSYRKKRRGKTGPGEGTPPAERRSAGRKVRQGRVVSDKPDKTITVQIEVVRRHTHYEKIIRHSNTLHAHDERNEANQGDLVRVVETRPLSRTKRWRLVEILEKAK
jgi:small subunit ribosomal protein S17